MIRGDENNYGRRDIRQFCAEDERGSFVFYPESHFPYFVALRQFACCSFLSQRPFLNRDIDLGITLLKIGDIGILLFFMAFIWEIAVCAP